MSFPVLKVKCADRPGLVKTITEALMRYDANIVRNDEFVDRLSGEFFMRTVFENVEAAKFQHIERDILKGLPDGAEVALMRPYPKKIVILATKEYHCVGDMLLRHHFGELNASIAAIISNHDVLNDLAARFDIPFHCVPHENRSREDHEAEIVRLIDGYDVDYIILAKYMRVLSAAAVTKYAKKIINIHHSFLPAFVGAKPYHQAYERGVKMIGATAHFVTNELDEGPIIAQDVISVGHMFDPKAMSQAGREVETRTLASALKLVFDDRVFVTGNKTVVF